MILVEIHGHGGKSARFDTEISSGSEEQNKWSLELAKRLEFKLGGVEALQKYTISGNFNEIYFKAQNTLSITTNDWISFHIELPKSIRAAESEYKVFCEFLAEGLKELLTELKNILKIEV
jgi:hypothetical protein